MVKVDTGREGIDLKRLWKQFVHKLSIVIAAVIAGAIIGVLAYNIYAFVVGPDTVYEIRNDYYVYFNYDASFNGADYYNAYTWDSILKDDPIVDYALTLMPDVSKEQILETVTGEIIGDYRILTIICKGTDPELVTTISEAYKKAVPNFADRVPILEKIEVWTAADMISYDPYTRDVNAGILGALIGFLFSTFVILFACAVDDGIYVERDWIQRYDNIPFLGKKDTDEYKVNLEHILGNEADYLIFDINEFEFNAETFSRLRESNGVILQIRQGKDKAEIIDKVIFTLNKQDVKIVGMMFSI